MLKFVTYGDSNYTNSLIRIKNQAEALDIFEDIKAFTPDDIPEGIRNLPLFKAKRGGGYWLWKPFVVRKTLLESKDGDIVVYLDAGCSIMVRHAFLKLISYLKTNDAVFFELSGRNVAWCKRDVLKFFGKHIPTRFMSCSQIMASAFFIRKTPETMKLFEKWYEISRKFPELFSDVEKDKIKLESKEFIEHRHDQAVLTAIIYSDFHTAKLKILPDIVDNILPWEQAIFASRISDDNMRGSMKRENVLRSIVRIFVLGKFRRIRNAILSKL